MGFGDVKLALDSGVVLRRHGWGSVLVGTFAGFLLFSLYGVGRILAGSWVRLLTPLLVSYAARGARRRCRAGEAT
ncbi:hypothetical protein [Streptomyces dysideae]|uniref:Prepilin type IV endopeptidase peptidase domain-containing protein n=1 Tax=Streptomyces dysideae TaxID=909626 RepID=A0A101US92_9ACTN|nr:hypothetical protein [Streptomyces dysideae]KUO15913.1 hypothetical protein AQJ91_38480 [Streptomyces dysideae]